MREFIFAYVIASNALIIGSNSLFIDNSLFVIGRANRFVKLDIFVVFFSQVSHIVLGNVALSVTHCLYGRFLISEPYA